jgi:hypothetical protein
MKKRLPKLTLRSESLRLLDHPTIAGAAVTDAPTCPLSCAPTCGVPGTPAHAAAGPTGRACCV